MVVDLVSAAKCDGIIIKEGGTANLFLQKIVKMSEIQWFFIMFPKKIEFFLRFFNFSKIIFFCFYAFTKIRGTALGPKPVRLPSPIR